MSRFKEIIERRNKIAVELESDTADLEALETELNELDTEEQELRSKVERRSSLLNRVSSQGTPIENRGGADMLQTVQETLDEGIYLCTTSQTMKLQLLTGLVQGNISLEESVLKMDED